jgi:2,3-bisphosphoglycerate-dependent phosphoglycerate mutase
MTTLLLVRHAETAWNREGRFQGHADPPLSPAGRRQAQALAEELETRRPAAVYASDLRRASETEEIVASRLDLPLRLDPGLREVDIGEWSGLTWPEITARFPEGVERHSARGHGWEHGESHEEMAERVIASLRGIAERHRGDRVLVVVHGGTMRALAAHIDGLPIVEHRRQYSEPVRNCELQAVVVENGALRRQS